MEVRLLAEAPKEELLSSVGSDGGQSAQRGRQLIEEWTSGDALEPLHLPRRAHVEACPEDDEEKEKDERNGDEVVKGRAEDEDAQAVAEDFESLKARRRKEVVDDAQVSGNAVHNYAHCDSVLGLKILNFKVLKRFMF